MEISKSRSNYILEKAKNEKLVFQIHPSVHLKYKLFSTFKLKSLKSYSPNFSSNRSISVIPT